MSKSTILEDILKEFHKDTLPKLFFRNIEIPNFPPNIRKALIFIGMRRVGKTYLMFQHMQTTLQQGLAKEKILYMNFEDDRLQDFTIEDFQTLLDVYFELYPQYSNADDLAFYFDEIQNVKGWDQFIRRLIDRERMTIYITGSSAKCLSKEIATSLRGRSLETEVFPLQLAEYLDYHEVNWNQPTAKDRSAIQHHTKNYLKRGGFPEILDLNDSLHHRTIQSYINAAVFRDVIDRHQLKNAHLVKLFLLHCLQNIAAPLSVTKVHKAFKSRGEVIGRNALYEYLEYFEDAYLICSVPIFDLSLRKRQVNPKKIYCVDPGIVYSYSVKPQLEEGTSLENAVYLTLRHLGQENIFYYKTHSGKEIDFITQKETGKWSLIQVCLNMDDPATQKREIAALVEASQECKVNHSTIVTLETEECLEQEGCTIHVLPFWKWATQPQK